MVDLAYREPRLAGLYDELNPWGPGDDFYLELVMSARSVLDVGCGTGALSHRARAAGHTGRLCGLDPAAAMLDRARTRSDIDWVLGDLRSVEWRQRFDLVVMAGHAFQVLVADDDLRASLATVRSVLAVGGRFAFETRNPQVRSWERWTATRPVEIFGSDGAAVRVEREVDAVDGDVVRFTETFTSTCWDRPRVSRSALRFLDADALSSFLNDAGLAIDEQYGDWDRTPLVADSPEIITVVRRDGP